MKKLVLLVIVVIVGVAIWQNYDPTPDPVPEPPPNAGPSPIDAHYDHTNPIGLPSIRPGKTDRQLLGVGGPCDDPWVPQALQEITGIRTLWGKACDPGLYNGGRWANYDELKTAIRNRLSDCADPWVTLAVVNSYGRPPLPAECDHRRYNGGSWSRYEDLVTAVVNAPRVSFDPAWSVLVLVYDKTAISSYTTSPGSTAPSSGPPSINTSMDAPTVAHVKDVTDLFANHVSEWSDYKAKVDVTVIASDMPLKTVTFDGNDSSGKPRWWVSPRDVAAELDRYAPEGRYDSVIVVTKQWNGAGAEVPRRAWGLAMGPARGSKAVDFQDGTHGMSYADIPLPASGRFGGVYPDEIFVHEWLHGVEGYWREIGFSNMLPAFKNTEGACAALLDNGGFWKNDRGGPIYKSGDTWQPFLSLFMKGQVNGTLGVPPDRWPRGGPTKFHPDDYGSFPDPGAWGPSGDSDGC